MYKLKTVEVFASEIAGLINKKLIGEDLIILRPSSLADPVDHSFICVENKDKELINNILQLKEVLLVTDIPMENAGQNYSVIWSETPKLDYLKIICDFFLIPDEVKIAPTALIHHNAKIGKNVAIGEHVVIGSDVEIGDNTKILHNAVIVNQVQIGKNCIIKHNSTIGSEGFDFEIDKLGIPVHYPHTGKIKIGNNVWIGSNSCIESGKINDTQIGNDVKIDDLVQIGYNCRIGAKTLITAGAVIERDVCVGENCLISSNTTIKQYVHVGDDVIVGVGSVVLRDIESMSVYVGNPARFLRNK